MTLKKERELEIQQQTIKEVIELASNFSRTHPSFIRALEHKYGLDQQPIDKEFALNEFLCLGRVADENSCHDFITELWLQDKSLCKEVVCELFHKDGYHYANAVLNAVRMSIMDWAECRWFWDLVANGASQTTDLYLQRECKELQECFAEEIAALNNKDKRQLMTNKEHKDKMLTVQIPTKPYDDTKLYTKKEHTFNEGITILVGQNGAGKSTLLLFLKEKCDREKLPLFLYDNYSDGGDGAKSKYGFYGDMTALATACCSSEGQQIYMNFGYMMQSLGAFVKKNRGAKQIVLAFDAIDSGLDLANIAEIKDFLNIVVKDIQKDGSEVYVLITANSYGFVKNIRCYDVAKNSEIYFNSYEEYEKFILSQAKRGKQ